MLVGEEVCGRRKLPNLRGREVAERSNVVEIETRDCLEVLIVMMTQEDRHEHTDHGPVNFVSLDIFFVFSKVFQTRPNAATSRPVDVAAGGSKVCQDVPPKLASKFREKRVVKTGVAWREAS